MDTNISKQTTVIICAAGMGTRLGIGTTKALVDIEGIPLIIRQLELLKEFDDVRIVVGFQAERIIQIVKEYRRDVVFVFNYEYETTGIACSLRKGSLASRKYILSIDGDILINPDDFFKLMSLEQEWLGITTSISEEPIMASVENNNVISLSKGKGDVQWPGIAKIKSEKLLWTSSYVYEIINELLPLPAHIIRAREIDTQDDYEKALEWFKKGWID